MKIKVNSFCSLSRNPSWHSFLGRVTPDLLTDLKGFLRTSTGCKSARIKMVELYQKLYARDKGDAFEEFIRQHFPYIVESGDEQPKSCATKRPAPKSSRRMVTHDHMNKHKVFKRYQPSMLTFPHKLILVDADHKKLLKSVDQFLSDKVRIDFIIIEDHAYVEYLLPKYADVQRKLQSESLEIMQYRLRNKQ